MIDSLYFFFLGEVNDYSFEINSKKYFYNIKILQISICQNIFNTLELKYKKIKLN